MNTVKIALALMISVSSFTITASANTGPANACRDQCSGPKNSIYLGRDYGDNATCREACYRRNVQPRNKAAKRRAFEACLKILAGEDNVRQKCAANLR